MKRLWLLVLFVCLLLTLSGCERPGTAEAVNVETKANGQIDSKGLSIKTKQFEVHIPPGYDAKISTAGAQQPTPADESANAVIKKEVIEADSGNAGKTPSAYGLGGTLWIGIGLIIIGLMIFLSKRAGVTALLAPGPTGLIMRLAGNLPKGSGIGLMILGGCIIVLPWVLDSIQPLVIPVTLAVVGILLAWWIYNIVQHERKDAHDNVATERIT